MAAHRQAGGFPRRNLGWHMSDDGVVGDDILLTYWFRVRVYRNIGLWGEFQEIGSYYSGFRDA